MTIARVLGSLKSWNGWDWSLLTSGGLGLLLVALGYPLIGWLVFCLGVGLSGWWWFLMAPPARSGEPGPLAAMIRGALVLWGWGAALVG